MQKLAIVRHEESADRIELMLFGQAPPRIVRAELADVDTPKISLELHAYFISTGEAAEYAAGLVAVVRFLAMARGRKRELVGLALPLLRGAALVLPRGLFSERSEQRLHGLQKAGNAVHAD